MLAAAGAGTRRLTIRGASIYEGHTGVGERGGVQKADKYGFKSEHQLDMLRVGGQEKSKKFACAHVI